MEKDSSIVSESSSSSSEENGQSQNDESRSSGDTSQHLLGHRETVVVNRSKALVYVALLVTALTLSVGAFFATERSENNEFEAEVSCWEAELALCCRHLMIIHSNNDYIHPLFARHSFKPSPPISLITSMQKSKAHTVQLGPSQHPWEQVRWTPELPGRTSPCRTTVFESKRVSSYHLVRAFHLHLSSNLKSAKVGKPMLTKKCRTGEMT